MDTSLPIRVLPALGLALLAWALPAGVVRAQTPPAPAPVRTVDADPEFDHWVRVLVRQSESANAEVANSARVALDGLGARGRARADALRQEVRPTPPGERAGRPGPPPGPGPEGRGPNDGRGPRAGERPDGPPPCGPGCCLHGRGARDGGDRPPFPPRDGRGPGRAGPRDSDRDPRTGPPPDRGPRPPFPHRDEPSRTPRSVPKET